jgi:DNA-binding Lrp family transcriptional regulator
MLKVQPNSRQIPSNEIYTADKKYNDLLYGTLQEMSYVGNEGIRYVNKSDISYVKLAEKLNLTRQTVSSRFKHLLEIGLINYEEENKRYQLCSVDKTLCSLVPFETLRKLNNTLNQNTISIYVYLLKRFIANGEQPYQVLMAQMKKFIGIATTTTSNNAVITDILCVLQLLKLIDMEYVKGEDNKTNIVIKVVRNVIPN